MFSILIPTFNNINCLKLCINSIKKNSKFNHQIVCHVNIGDDGTTDYLQNEKIDFSYTDYNSGICEGINKAAKLATYDYYLYAHDDFYFCPQWDLVLLNEIKKVGHINFYLSGTMMNEGQIKFDCGSTPAEFDEDKFLKKYKNYNYFNFQGSTWAPSLVHKDIWNQVGGFSEEFNPGICSDPDFNMKLWKKGIRVFKGLGKCRVYHFSSVSLRKKAWNNGAKTFLLKWGISIKFFKKFYLRSAENYQGPLMDPYKDYKYFIELFITKLKFFYALIISYIK